MNIIGISGKYNINNIKKSESVIFSEDGKWIIEGVSDGKIKIYNSIDY